MASSFLEQSWKGLKIPNLEKELISQLMRDAFYKTAEFITGYSPKKVNARQPTLPVSEIIKQDPEIHSLQAAPETTPRRPNLQHFRARQDYYEEERLKAEENQKKIKEWRRHQLKREAKLRKLLLDMENLEKDAKEKQLAEKEAQETKAKEEYSLELEKMQQRKEKRNKAKEELREKEEEYREKLKQKPLYKQIEARYHFKIELPNLEKQKERLAKLRMLSSPLDREEMQEHMSWYKRVKESSRNKSVVESRSGYPLSKFGSKLLKEDKKYVEEETKAIQERMLLLEKQKKYSENVKELFTPTIDRFKQKELELRKEKLLHPIRKDPFKRSTDNLNTEEEWRPKKYPKNPMVPTPPPPKEIKVVDYLAERRNKRHSRDESVSQIGNDIQKVVENEEFSNSLQKVKHLTTKLEQKARAKEAIISSIPHNNAKSLEESENVNDMLLTAVKAKLALLEKMKS